MQARSTKLKKFEVEEETTIQDLLDLIAATLKMRSIDTYRIYDVSSARDPVTLRARATVTEVMEEWQKPVKLGGGPFAKKGIAKHNLVLSKRLYVDELGELPRDPVELHMLYATAKGCVMRGKYACTDMEALLLADPIHDVDESAGWPHKK